MTVDLRDPIASLAAVEALPASDHSSGMRGRWVRLGVTAAVVLALVAGGLLYKRATGRAVHNAESGPVRTESDTTTGIVAEVGEVVTFGGIVLENFSDHPAVLESIRIDPPLTPAMSLVDVKVAGKERGIGMVGADRGFPPSSMSDVPPEAFRPLPGAVVPPNRPGDEWGIEVFMAFKVTRPGRFGFHHALVDYRIGGKRHRIRAADGFFICAPSQVFPGGCIQDVEKPED